MIDSYFSNFYRGKKVLVTGHTGFKGSWLCQVLILLGSQVFGYALENRDSKSLFALCHGFSKTVQSCFGDIRDFEKLSDFMNEVQPDIVIHLAAQPIVLDSYNEPRYTYDTNVMGTVNILEATRRCHSVRAFVNVTTDKVYQNRDELDHPFVEDEKLDGFDPYSNSKSCSELVTACYKRSFFKNSVCAISTARAGNVIGGGDFSPHRIMTDAVQSALSHKPISVRNKNSIRPYQFVLEALFAYLLIAKCEFDDASMAGCYNVGPDLNDVVTTGDLIDIFCNYWGNGCRWIDAHENNAKHEASFLSLDNTLLKKKFGWSPVTDVKEAVKNVVEWSRTFGNGGDVIGVMKSQISDYCARFMK